MKTLKRMLSSLNKELLAVDAKVLEGVVFIVVFIGMIVAFGVRI